MPKKDVAAKLPSFAKALPWVLIFAGVVGIVCSFILTYDQIQVWQNPHYSPACSLNPVISCGSVIGSKQGHILGIPAPFFGLLMFPVLATVGVSMLAGARFKKWFWIGMQLAVSGGVVFALWLFWLSLYRIRALCPFCLATDVVVYASAWYVTLYNLEKNHIVLPAKLAAVSNFMRKRHLDILLLVYLLIAGYILHHFWYFYKTYFS